MFTEQKCHSEVLDGVCVSEKKDMKRRLGGGSVGGERRGDPELEDSSGFQHLKGSRTTAKVTGQGSAVTGQGNPGSSTPV